VTHARSKYIYNAAGRELLAEFKFNRREAAGAWLARELQVYARCGADGLLGADADQVSLVVPVPIHAQRRRERGFNQAETLARAAAAGFGLACEPGALVRTRATPSQVGLTAAQRKLNVRGAFKVPDHMRMKLVGKCVLIVDDLMTTGATLRACATALRQGGVRAATGLTLFSTVHEVEHSDWTVPPPRTWL
jgi:ComF family protein